MAFTLYCLVRENGSDLSLDALAAQLREYFSKTDGFKQEYEEDPFDQSDRNLILSWGDWWIRVFYETGANVMSDSEVIAKHADSGRASLISAINRRIRVLFADDEDLVYTNHIIFMMEFLEARAELIIFDPQRSTFVN